MTDGPRGGAGTPDAGERSGRSSSAGTPATRASAQTAAPACASVANRERRRAVEGCGSACLRVSARLPYPYGLGLMVLGFRGSREVSGKVR